jgi:hypothetical protein
MPSYDPLVALPGHLVTSVPRYPAAKRVTDVDFAVPGADEAVWIPTKNYNVRQLKAICMHYGLRRGGNKPVLRSRCYNYIRLVSAATTIQRWTRGHLQRALNRMRGPGYTTRGKCTNQTEVLSLCDVAEIPWNSYVAYTDDEGCTWAFDSDFLTQTARNAHRGEHPENPYNRNPLPIDLFIRLAAIERLERALGHTHPRQGPDVGCGGGGGGIPSVRGGAAHMHMNPVQRATALFSHLERETGIIASPEWVTSLDAQDLLRFYRELYDIWHHRAGLSAGVRMSIVPPRGEPFHGMSWSDLQFHSSAETVLSTVLLLCERTAGMYMPPSNYPGVGAHYVLIALTIVSPGAASAIPWLTWAGGTE